MPPCVTAHLIDKKVDAGFFISEATVEVLKEDTLETISSRILKKQIEMVGTLQQRCIRFLYLNLW